MFYRKHPSELIHKPHRLRLIFYYRIYKHPSDMDQTCRTATFLLLPLCVLSRLILTVEHLIDHIPICRIKTKGSIQERPDGLCAATTILIYEVRQILHYSFVSRSVQPTNTQVPSIFRILKRRTSACQNASSLLGSHSIILWRCSPITIFGIFNP